jgi:hypothetical protein
VATAHTTVNGGYLLHHARIGNGAKNNLEGIGNGAMNFPNNLFTSTVSIGRGAMNATVSLELAPGVLAGTPKCSLRHCKRLNKNPAHVATIPKRVVNFHARHCNCILNRLSVKKAASHRVGGGGVI